GYPKGAKPPTTTTAPARRGGGNVDDDDDNDMIKGNEDENGFHDDDEDMPQFGPGGGGSIESFSVSSVNGNTIWVGTSNGLIKVTKDHGATWEDVTIPNLKNPTRADISATDASHQDLGTAYVAIDYHSTGDYEPCFYRTHDYGKTWTKIVNGLPTDLP